MENKIREMLIIPTIAACLAGLLLWLFRKITGVIIPPWAAGGIALFFGLLFLEVFGKTNK